MSHDKKNRLLVVEDSHDLQELTKELFESEGYEVNCVSNGKEALSFLRCEEVRSDLILLDLMMPVMDGYQFRKEQLLDQRIAAIPVIILTADGNGRSKADKLGVRGIYNKASGVDELLSVVKENLEDNNGL